MTPIDDEEAFRLFAQNLERELEKYQDDSGERLIVKQRRQIKRLISLENQFRKFLIKNPMGNKVYKEFVKMICDQKRNILAARPFFRERQEIFTKYISKALKKRNEKSLYRFRFNYQFVYFVLNTFQWPQNGKVVRTAKKIQDIRRELVEMNLPLAISQARIFWSNTPKSHLSYMDLVQIHCGGLLAGIDKFVPPPTRGLTEEQSLEAYRKFRAVALGRMIGDRIDNYSETLLHFYPIDKRKIYRANKLLRHFAGEVDYEKLSGMVNHEVEDENHHTNPSEIADLVASASCVSSDALAVNGNESPVDKYVANYEDRPDLAYEQQQSLDLMRKSIVNLPLRERKVLTLKGVHYE